MFVCVYFFINKIAIGNLFCVNIDENHSSLNKNKIVMARSFRCNTLKLTPKTVFFLNKFIVIMGI